MKRSCIWSGIVSASVAFHGLHSCCNREVEKLSVCLLLSCYDRNNGSLCQHSFVPENTHCMRRWLTDWMSLFLLFLDLSEPVEIFVWLLSSLTRKGCQMLLLLLWNIDSLMGCSSLSVVQPYVHCTKVLRYPLFLYVWLGNWKIAAAIYWNVQT